MLKVLFLLCILTVALSSEIISHLSPGCRISIKFGNYSEVPQPKLFCSLMCNSTKERQMVANKQPNVLFYRFDEIDKAYHNKMVAVQLKKNGSVGCILVDVQPSSNLIGASNPEKTVPPTINECGENYLLFKNIDWCVKISTREQQWNGVSQACISEGGVLAIVDTPEKDKAISAYLKDNDIKDVWIGLSDTKTEGEFVWVDGTPLTNDSFQNWHEKQPDDWEGLEDCAHYSFDWDYKWNDVRCDAYFPYLCEKKKRYGTDPAPLPVAPNKGILTCPSGWDLNEAAEVCYHIGEEVLNFEQARDYCNELTGFLASIPNAPEMTFIQEWLNGSESIEDIWIGLRRVDEITFEWIDGTTLTHESWNSREPDNEGSNENCVSLNRLQNYMWADSNCDYFYRPLCRASATHITFYARVCPAGCLLLQNTSDFTNTENSCPSHSTGSLICEPNTENYLLYLIIVSGVSSFLFIFFIIGISFYCYSRRKVRSQKAGTLGVRSQKAGTLGNGHMNRALELSEIERRKLELTPYVPPPFLPPPKMKDDCYNGYEYPPISPPTSPKEP